MTIVELLNAKRATPETVLEVMNTTIAELSDDKQEDEMLAEMRQAVGAAEVEKLQQLFRAEPQVVREAALAWLAVADADPRNAPLLASAVKDADRSGVLTEAALVAVVAMYAMYLIATNGVKSKTVKIEQKSDGSYNRSEQTVYASFSESLRAAFNVFSKSPPKDG